MTDLEAQDMLKQLTEYFGERVAPVSVYCNAFYEFFDLPEVRKSIDTDEDAKRGIRAARMYITKSCLLSRMVYLGLKPSKTPCPVHKGRWSGVHFGWPSKDKNGKAVEPMLQEWINAGCRCYLHGCGCTTGWQPE